MEGCYCCVWMRHRSKYWSQFISQLFGSKNKKENRVVSMKVEYDKFKNELRKNFTNKQVIRIC